MPVIAAEPLSDPRLNVYRHLKTTNLTRGSSRFIAEGRLVVERLLASDYRVDSLLLSERRINLLDELAVPDSLDVYLISDDQARKLIGFQFHAGVLGCGMRRRPLALSDLPFGIPRQPEPTRQSGRDSTLLIACPHITDPDNLGSLIRLCRAFGVQALLLGPGSCDPFSRRTLRVSMGNTFDQPIVESANLAADLESLRRERGYTLSATVLTEDAIPLHQATGMSREVLLLGNEATGLADEWIARADRRVTIPMSGGTDSLNVAVAAGIFLHWLRRPG